MNSLLYLSLIKIKATIRSYFSKVSVGIFTMIGVIFYGFLFWKLAFDTETSATSNIGFNISILLGIGFLGLILISSFLSKRKALVIETDAFYLFTGPFKRKDIMLFILRNNLVQSFMFSLLVVFISSMYSRGSYDLFLVIILVITYTIMLFIGLALVDYLYILAISNDKYKDSNKLVGVVFLIIIGVITLYGAYLKGFNFDELGLFIVKGDLFNYIPLLGWTNLLLTSIYSINTLGIIIGSILLIGSLITIVLLFVNFKGDFYEKAMIDSAELTALVNNNKDGDQLALNQDIKTKATSTFRYGAGAIFSRNMLELRKTNSFITKGDILLLIVYFVLCWFIGLGHMFYMYM
ncbi:MAG: putative ABC exporter domain-containing protein, partial [Erysipelotrichaceae bacterium]